MMRTAMLSVFVLVTLAAAAALLVAVGVYVYRDAARRGMNALLWALVAVLAPSLVGLLIYLLVRGNYSDLRCPRCDAPVEERFVVCPRCGAKLRPSCPNCAAPVEPDWKVCPKCAQPLPAQQTDVCPPVKAKDRSLWKVLAVVLIVPLLLITLLVLAMRAPISGGGVVGERSATFSEYYDEMAASGRSDDAAKVKDWAKSVDDTVRSAYALQYTNSYDQHFFLVYVPSIGKPSRVGFGHSSSIFGTTLTLDLDAASGERAFFSLYSYAEDAPKLKVKLDGKTIPCEVTMVDYNPTLMIGG